MKKHLIFLFAIAITLSCGKQKEQNKIDQEIEGEPVVIQKHVPPADGKYPIMAFTEKAYDFGDIKQGDKVTHKFTFKNTGEADLVISDAYGSCGCTVPEYPKEAIKPGEEGQITVTFNSAGKNGKQQKTVTLVTNTASAKEQLQIKVNINPGA